MKKYACIISLVLTVGLLGFFNQVFALGGYWKPMKGKTYTVTFTDEAKNTIIGEFKKTVRWQWEQDGSVKVTEWDDEATFMFKDQAGKEHKIKNTTIKARIVNLEPGMTGKLKGNIQDTIK